MTLKGKLITGFFTPPAETSSTHLITPGPEPIVADLQAKPQSDAEQEPSFFDLKYGLNDDSAFTCG